MMYKVVPSWAWDFGTSPAAIIKVSRHGLCGQDRNDLLEKRAADRAFVSLIDKIAMMPGDIPLHIIALGATEVTGPNRNGDGFTEKACREYGSSFVGRKLAEYRPSTHNGSRYYFDHENTDPEKSYGYTKAAAYNDRMGRMELLVIANGSKEAARRNGGFVLPDDVLEDYHKGKVHGHSMSCKVAFDVCSVCGNKAPTRKEYCTKESCHSPEGLEGLGCRDGLTKLLKTGYQQYVDNPQPIFFDISKVGRPADRTAYGGLATDFQKSAAAGDIVHGGAWLAEQYGMSEGLSWGPTESAYHARQIKLARQLAELEANADQDPASMKLAFSDKVQTDVDFAAAGQAGTTKFGATMKALADEKVLLSPRDFLKLASPNIPESTLRVAVADMRLALPTAFRKLAAEGNLARDLDHAFAVDQYAIASQDQRRFAAKLAETRSCCPCQVPKRAQLAVLRGDSLSTVTKSASAKQASAEATGLARQYSLYQLSALAAMPETPDSLLTLRTVVVHNNL